MTSFRESGEVQDDGGVLVRERRQFSASRLEPGSSVLLNACCSSAT